MHALNRLSQTLETIIRVNEWNKSKNVSMFEGRGSLVSAYLIIWKENCVGALKFLKIECLCGLLFSTCQRYVTHRQNYVWLAVQMGM